MWSWTQSRFLAEGVEINTWNIVKIHYSGDGKNAKSATKSQFIGPKWGPECQLIAPKYLGNLWDP